MSIPQPIQIWPNHDQIISAYYQLSADKLTKKTVENKQGVTVIPVHLLYKQGNLQVVLQKTDILSETT